MAEEFNPNLAPDFFVVPLAMDYLVEWAEKNGAKLDPKVEVYQGVYGTSIRVKRPKDGIAAEPLTPRSNIVSCPYGICLSYLNALNEFSGLPSRSPPLPKQFMEKVNPHIIGRMFLIQQFLMGKDSFWAPYIESLPQPDEPKKLATPLFWDEDALTCLKGTNIAVEAERRKKGWKEEFQLALYTLMMAPSEDASGKESPEVETVQKLFKKGATPELYLWACTIFSSRSFPSHLIPVELYGSKLDEQISQDDLRTWRDKIKSEGPYAILLPLVDIANHSPTAKVEWFIDAKAEPMSVSIINDDEVPVGEQIFNNYAPKGNSELLLGYGFILPGNDDFMLKLKCPPEKAEIRRAQDNHKESEETEEGRMFAVRRQPFPGSKHEGELKDFGCFEPGLIDLLCLLVANEREEEGWFAGDAPMDWSPEENIMETIDSEQGRNIVAALAVLRGRLDIALKQLNDNSPDLSKIKETAFTEVALAYREGQVATITKAITTITSVLKPLFASKDKEEIRKPSWPQNPIITLTTAADHFINYNNREHLWSPFLEHLPYNDELPNNVYSTAHNTRSSSVVFQALLHHIKTKGLTKLDDFYDIFWAMWVWHILCIWGSEQNDLSDPLNAWADNMLGSYSIRPVPDEDDKTWQHLKEMVETLPETFYGTAYIGHTLAWEGYFNPEEKNAETHNKRKPRCKRIEGESQHQWRDRSVKDYWLKTAMLALKIARGEIIRDGLAGLVPVGYKSYLPEFDKMDPERESVPKEDEKWYFEDFMDDRSALFVQRFQLPEGEKTQRQKVKEQLRASGDWQSDLEGSDDE